jgi:hypothetical protein
LKIEEPISKLTEDYDVPIKDMDAWVARPAEIRRKEAKAKGRISRPMNPFMLYRSAYSERTKKLVGVTKHQVVSKIAGQGWKLEPHDVRKKYEDLAKLERDAHAATHPEYKFSHKKQRKCVVNRRDKEIWSESESEANSTVSGMTPVPPYVHPHDQSFEEGYFNANRGFSPYGTPEHDISMLKYTSPSWPNTIYPTGLPMYPGSSHSLNRTTNGQLYTDSRLQQGVYYSSSLVGLPGASHHELFQQPHFTQVASPMNPALLVYSNTSEVVGLPNMARAAFISVSPHTQPTYGDDTITDYCPDTTTPSMSGILRLGARLAARAEAWKHFSTGDELLV